MRPQYDVETLIETIKRACSVPTSQLTYTNSGWAALANDLLQTDVVPLIMSTREDYFVTFEDVSSPSGGVIPFPESAIGSKLRNVCLVTQTNPLILVNLPRIDLDVIAGVGFYNYNTLSGFYVQGNDIYLYPNNSVPVGSTIRLYLYRRSLVLAAPDQYGQVESIDSGTNTLTLNYVPTDWEIGTELNAVGSQPNFLITNAAMEITSVSTPTVVVDTIEGIEVGDYISELGYSAVPQIPIEAHNYLAQLTAAKALVGLGDNEGAKIAFEVAERLKTSLLIVTSQRVDGSVKKIINPSGGLRLGSGLGRRGWGW